MHGLLGIGLGLPALFFLLLLLQRFDDTVNGGIAVFFAHLRQSLQGVLQVDGIGMWHKFVENLRATRQLFVVLSFLVEQADGFAVAALGIVELLLLPIQVAEFQEQHALFDAASGCLLVAFLVGTDGVSSVALGEIDVTDGVVYLIQVVLVLVAGGHTLQPADHLLGLTGSHHLGHSDAGVELNLVRRVLGDHLLVSLISLLLMSELSLELSEQEVLACLLALAHLVLNDLLQVGHSFRIVARVDVVIGQRVVPLLLCSPMDAVAAHVADHVLSIVYPVLLNVALGEPGAGTPIDGGLRGVEATHVVER